MNTIDVIISGKKRTYNMPSDWHELNEAQFISLMNADNDIDLLKTMGVPSSVLSSLDDIQISQLVDLFEWTMDNNANVRHWYIPKIQINGKTLWSPGDFFSNMPFEQFIYVDSFFAKYAKGIEKDSEIKMIFYLYQEFDIWNKERSDALIRKHNDIDQRIVNAILSNYALMRNSIMRAYPLVFPNTNTSSSQSSTWVDVLDNIVGDDIKDMDKYAAIPVHTMFKYITRKIKQVNE